MRTPLTLNFLMRRLARQLLTAEGFESLRAELAEFQHRMKASSGTALSIPHWLRFRMSCRWQVKLDGLQSALSTQEGGTEPATEIEEDAPALRLKIECR